MHNEISPYYIKKKQNSPEYPTNNSTLLIHQNHGKSAYIIKPPTLKSTTNNLYIYNYQKYPTNYRNVF